MQPRTEIESLKPCPHGGPNYEELADIGLKPEEILDFSVSSNPYGPPPGIRKVLGEIAIDRYPDSESTELREALGRHLGVSSENIIAGNGSMEILRLITTAYLGNGDIAVIPEPTFGEYEIACRIAGAAILRYRASEENQFQFDVRHVVDLLQEHSPRVIFLCNPNNPTGQYLQKQDIMMILEAGEGSLLVLDEAYVSFVDNRWHSTDLLAFNNLILVRSMTKDYALAGLRLGYAIAHPDTVANLRKVRPPWNVNTAAQTLGVAALQNWKYPEHCRERISEARGYLISELNRRGLKPLTTQAHFFLMKVGDAAQFRRELLNHGIMVRDCTSFGLPDYIRISPRSLSECQKLIQTIDMIWK